MSPWLRLLVGLAIAAAVVAVGAAPALALTDEIAYRCDVDICLVQPDVPGGVTNLTDNGTTSLDGAPSWSPDGTQVAFVSTFGGGRANIFVMQPDAPGDAINLATQLTHYPNTGSADHRPGLVARRDAGRVRTQRVVRARRPASSSSPPTGRR